MGPEEILDCRYVVFLYLKNHIHKMILDFNLVIAIVFFILFPLVIKFKQPINSSPHCFLYELRRIWVKERNPKGYSRNYRRFMTISIFINFNQLSLF